MPAAIEPVDAPFAFDLPRRSRSVSRELRLESPADARTIQAAIDRLAAAGGGRVVVGPGEWRTGRLLLKTDVELHLEEGALLRFSGKIEDYLPAVFTRWEGLEIMGLGGLVYAHNQERIALTGRGMLVGPDAGPVREARRGLSDKIVDPAAPVAQRLFDGREGRHYFRPYFVNVVGCRDVLIEGVTLRNGPFWNVVPIYSNRVAVRGVTIDSRGVVNGDGVNVDSSRNVLVEYCSTNTGDDCYAVKAGRNEDGLRVGRSAEQIVIRKCFADGGFGGFTVGSETAGGVRQVCVRDCLFDGVSYAAYFKTRRPRGGGGDDLLVERVRFRSKSHGVFFDMIGAPMYVGDLGNRLPKRMVNEATPHYRGVVLRDLAGVAGGEALKIKGIPESPATDVRLERVDIQSAGFINLADAVDIAVSDSTFTPVTPRLRLLDVRGLQFVRTQFATPGGKPMVVIREGEQTPRPEFQDCTPRRAIPAR